MSDRNELLRINKELFSKISSLENSIPEDLINQSNGDKWSIGQILEHLIKTQVGTIHILGGASSTCNRYPLQKVQEFQELFNDDTIKLPAGKTSLPSEGDKDLGRMLSKFSSNGNVFSSLISEIPLENEFTAFSHPHFGIMTGHEWILFNEAHSLRHLRQIEKLLR